MKPLSITALIFSVLSMFMPIAGIFLAMLCSVLAMIAFRSQPTLSGVVFGINTISTAFLSPSIILSDMASSGELDTNSVAETPMGESGDIYFFYVGFHLVALVVAIAWRLIRGAPKTS